MIEKDDSHGGNSPLIKVRNSKSENMFYRAAIGQTPVTEKIDANPPNLYTCDDTSQLFIPGLAITPVSVSAVSSDGQTEYRYNFEISVSILKSESAYSSTTQKEKTAKHISYKLPENISSTVRTLFAPGVTMQKLYDANKNGKGDSQLCWAAVSANLIAWWQDRYEAQEGKTLNTELPRKPDKIFEKFKSSYGDSEGTFLNGVLFYMAGASSTPKDDGGYLLDYIDKSKWNPYNPTAYTYIEKFGTLQEFSAAVLQGLQNGAVALGITNRNKNGTFGHAITIWGAEYSPDTNVIRALLVSDSDDGKEEIARYTVSQNSGYVKINDYTVYPSYDKIKNIMVLHSPQEKF